MYVGWQARKIRALRCFITGISCTISKENITFTCTAVVRLQNEGTICETLPGLFNSGSQRAENVLIRIYLYTENNVF